MVKSVKWLGYPHEESTWEPTRNLDNVKEMLQTYDEEHRSKRNSPKKSSQSKSSPEKTKKIRKH